MTSKVSVSKASSEEGGKVCVAFSKGARLYKLTYLHFGCYMHYNRQTYMWVL